MKRFQTPGARAALILGCLLACAGGQAQDIMSEPQQFQAGDHFAMPENGVRPAIWNRSARDNRAVRFSDYVDAYGNSIVVPASYCGPGCGGHGCQQCGGSGMTPSGEYCCACTSSGPGVYGQCPPPGTCPPYGYNDDMADLMGAGSLGLHQCGPHYFDARMEFVHMARDETFRGAPVDFTSLNVGNAELVLSSNQLNYDRDPAFRVVGRYDIGPLSVVEFSYFGLHDQDAEATFTDPNPVDENQGNLFSIFSEFGTNPANVPVAGGPMGTTDRAVFHRIALNSDLQTVELMYRRYWVGFSPRFSGTIFAGGRYTRLSEQFAFNSRAELGTFAYDVDAENDIVGLQMGADMWWCITQGVRMGHEGKAGIYNNRFKLDTVAAEQDLAGAPNVLVNESDNGNNVAFIGEYSLDLVVDVLPSWSIRTGYEALFINSVALASDNFNTASPFGLFGQPQRVPFASEQSNVFYHGWRIGAEYIW